MASKKKFKICHLYQNSKCQESLDYPVLEKTGHILSDKSICGNGDMLSIQVKFLNLMKRNPYRLLLRVNDTYREHVCLQTDMHIAYCNLWLIQFERAELRVSN